MDAITLNKKISRIENNLYQRRMLDAMEILRELIPVTRKEYLLDQLSQHQDTYRNMLRHSFSGIKDPDRKKIFDFLQRSLLELTDQVREGSLTEMSWGNLYTLKRQMEREKRIEKREVWAYLESITYDPDLSGILSEAGLQASGQLFSREEALHKVFNIIWLSDKIQESETELLNAVCSSALLPWHDKSLVVSALTLSLLRYFDANKFLLLIGFVARKEEQVWQRALVGLFLAFVKYNRRVALYPVLQQKTLEMANVGELERNIEAILIQFTKSRETTSVTRKWEEEILPRMQKLKPRLEEKLELDNIFKDEFGEEKNPDWETFFEDSPDLLNKLQEFTEMQMDGMDVFMSAFSQLKSFPFFREISNWFIPFYHENPAIQSALKSPDSDLDLSPLVEKLQHTFFMCNSDKYSFCLNLGLVPEQQKTMMMNMVSAEMENIAEVEKGENLINDFARTQSIYTQYLQDLYRFYKLHPWRQEFEDVFVLEPDLFENSFLSSQVSDPKTIRNIAELYFDKKFYSYALGLFTELLERDRSNIELFEKIAFCYEQQGEFERALDYYKRADLIEGGRGWIIRKIALCSKYLNRWEDALQYYREAEKLQTDDLKLQASIGQCFIHLQDYERALQYYFKVEVLAPENHKIRRPLAWCSFVLGKFEVAADYYERLLSDDPHNKFDLLNLAHTYLCQGKTREAISTYRRSYQRWSNSLAFEASFDEDRRHLEKHGLDRFDLDLLKDSIRLPEPE